MKWSYPIIFILMVFFDQNTLGQTILLNQPIGASYTGTDNPTFDTYSADVSNCTSVIISFDYEFSLPWEGSGNMETPSECGSGNCNPDPFDPLNNECFNCWDFIFAQVMLDGLEVDSDIVGENGTTDAEQSGTFNFIVCTEGATTVDLNIITNTWASDESITFSNIIISCYEATPMIMTNDPICTGQDLSLAGSATNDSHVATWSWTNDGSGIIADPTAQNTTASNAGDGETYTLTTTDPNDCTAQESVTITTTTVEGQLSGTGELCPGDCVDIDVIFSGGDSPYILDLLLDFPFPVPDIPFMFPGFPTNEQITICYDSGGPAIDPSTFTIDVPSISAGFSGSLTLQGFTDMNGCVGTVTGGPVSLSFVDPPIAIEPPPTEACDEGGGIATFNLAPIAFIISNNGQYPLVNFFYDNQGMFPLSGTYMGPSTTLWAMIEDSPCNSELVPVVLNVIDGGNGTLSIFCDASSSLDCTICDDDGIPGEMITIYLELDDPGAAFDFTLGFFTESGGPIGSITGNGIGSATISFNLTSSTVFNILGATVNGNCTYTPDFGSPITINYNVIPEIDDPGPLEGCGYFILPEIIGNNLPDNIGYYDMPGGMGTMYNVGDTIYTDDTLYIFGGVNNCTDEVEIEISITEVAILDDPDNVETCGTYVLPPITGTNLHTPIYSSLPFGNGDIFLPGTIISTSTNFYLYDTLCGSNVSILMVNILPGPVITNSTDTTACDYFVVPPIMGMDLSGNEAYYPQSDGSGVAILPGDTITEDSTIFIIDDTNGCNINIPVNIHILTPGIDTFTQSVCQGDSVAINGTYYTEDNLPPNITIPNGSSGGCDSIVVIDVTFLQSTMGTFTQSLCKGDSVAINGTYYNEDNLPPTITIPNGSSGGCDSIVVIDVTFLQSTMGTFTQSLCKGDSVSINGTYYTEDNLPPNITIPNGSSGGCDSIVVIDVTFLQSTMGTFTQSLCKGDSVAINGTYYTEDNLPPNITIPNGSSGGCDSIVVIDVTFLDNITFDYYQSICKGEVIMIGSEIISDPVVDLPVIFTSQSGCDSTVLVTIDVLDIGIDSLALDVCGGYSVEVGGMVFDQSNPSGMAVIDNGSANGCDSLVYVSLAFSGEMVDSLISFSTCDTSMILYIGGEFFYFDYPSGTVILESSDPQYCDTLITVNITYGMMEIDYEILQPTCPDWNTGHFVINSITGAEPFDIMYGGGNNTIAFSLPVDIPLPTGSGEMMITDAGGCTATIPYDILPGDGETISTSLDGDQITISGVSPDSIAWSPEEGLSCTDCLNPLATPDMTTQYQVTLFYGDTCMLIDTVLVEIEDYIPDYLLPQIFSPNGDGVNDYFYLTITDGAQGTPLEMIIYDRWGNKVFTENDAQLILTRGWDGTRSGTRVVSGVYVYSVFIEKEDGTTVQLFGDLTVVR